MRHFGLCAAIVLLSAAAAATTARADTWAPSEAKTLYEEGRYLDAARAFEAEFRANGRAGILYNAGLAREAAGPGNDALALLHWRQFLAEADDITERERTEVISRISIAEARTAPVEFTYDGPPSAHPEGIILRRKGSIEADRLELDWPQDQATLGLYVDVGKWNVQIRGPHAIAQEISFQVRRARPETMRFAILGTQALEPMPVRITLGPPRALRHGINLSWTGPSPAEHPKTRKAHAPSQKWTLAPGAWTLRANAKGYKPTESLVTISDKPVRLTIELESKVDWTRVGLGAGLGTASAGFLITGGVLLPSRLQNADDAYNSYIAKPANTNSTDANSRRRQLETSFALIGTGIGLAIPALTAIRPSQERTYLIEAATGGAITLAAGGLLVGSASCFRKVNKNLARPIASDTYDTCHTLGLAGSAPLGLGIGLLSGASLSFAVLKGLKSSKNSKLSKNSRRNGIHRKIANTLQLNTIGDRHGGSLLLRGRF
ncbi:MAG TPA: hypothetical protein ENJ18_05490 [Nannocystis exedens]|nr:hypothetical protein [Nannocystis exedens]